MNRTTRISALLLAVLLVFFALPVSGFAEKDPIGDLSLDSQGAYLCNLETGAVLYKKAATARMCPASLTKVVTALIVLENIKSPKEERVYIGDTSPYQYIVEDNGVNMQLVNGETFTVYDLLAGLLIASYCDAADILAVHTAGSVPAFVEKMNAKAEELHLENTHFENAHGLNATNHYSSPEDLATLFREALRFDVFVELISLYSYTIPANNAHESRVVRHTVDIFNPQNQYYLDAFVGGKSGFTDEAGRCLICYSKKDGLSFVSVLMGANMDSSKRYPGNMAWIETSQLVSYAYENYTVQTLYESGQTITTLPVTDSDQTVPVAVAEEVRVLVRAGVQPVPEITLPEILSATDVQDKKQVGTLQLNLSGEEYFTSYPLVLVWDGTPVVTKSALEKGAESAGRAIAGIFREDRVFVVLLILLLLVIAVTLPATRVAKRLHKKKSHRPKH